MEGVPMMDVHITTQLVSNLFFLTLLSTGYALTYLKNEDTKKPPVRLTSAVRYVFE